MITRQLDCSVRYHLIDLISSVCIVHRLAVGATRSTIISRHTQRLR